VSELFRRRASSRNYELTIDLEKQSVRDGLGFRASFHIDDYRREMLLQGLDEIGRTLLQEPLIAAFERRQAAQGAS
jgi:3-isopropylmalate/(R)-2-methylmalate dehydratase small subunit